MTNLPAGQRKPVSLLFAVCLPRLFVLVGELALVSGLLYIAPLPAWAKISVAMLAGVAELLALLVETIICDEIMASLGVPRLFPRRA